MFGTSYLNINQILFDLRHVKTRAASRPIMYPLFVLEVMYIVKERVLRHHSGVVRNTATAQPASCYHRHLNNEHANNNNL